MSCGNSTLVVPEGGCAGGTRGGQRRSLAVDAGAVVPGPTSGVALLDPALHRSLSVRPERLRELLAGSPGNCHFDQSIALELTEALRRGFGGRVTDLRPDSACRLRKSSIMARTSPLNCREYSSRMRQISEMIGSGAIVVTHELIGSANNGHWISVTVTYTRLLHKSWHVIVTRTPTFRVANASQNSPCSIRPCHDCRPIASVAYPHQR